MPVRRKQQPKEPALGSVLFEVGFKHEEPSSPVIISYVYCGLVEDNGEKYFLLVEFLKWWIKTQRGLPIEAGDGLKVRTLEQLLDLRKDWNEVVAWTQKHRKDWRKKMKE
jgi:hypothetical protein